jgi:hypothetical protein
MALAAKNRFSIVWVGLHHFTCIKTSIETEAEGLITDFWLYTP